MQKSNSSKQKSKQILASLVMGMNIVNSMAPMALAVQPIVQHVQTEAQPLNYASLPNTLDYLDDLVFSKAYASAYGGNETVPEMRDENDQQYISAGQSGTVIIQNGGEQSIGNGGKGTVNTMNAGMHVVGKGGSGIVSTNNGGVILVANGGESTVNAMSGGTQSVDGSGIVLTMDGGLQTVGAEHTAENDPVIGGYRGSATIVTMNGGTQYVAGTAKDGYSLGAMGTISTMNSGRQVVFVGEGTVNTMLDGTQDIQYGTGTIITMSGGEQTVVGTIYNEIDAEYLLEGRGFVNTMSNGAQTINEYAFGTVGTMIDGTQTINQGGSGMVNNMNAGLQTINRGGIGMVNTMIDGLQTIEQGGSGIVNTMNNGEQSILTGGTGTVVNIYGGKQVIADKGHGTIVTLANVGEQIISSGGTGVVTNMLGGGVQNVIDGATGVVTNLNTGGLQSIVTGGYGTVTNLNGGKQTINGGSGAVDNLYHGAQTISSGGSGTVTNMIGGSQVVASGGTATVTALKGGTQMVSAGGTSINTQLEGGAIAFHMGGVVQDLSMKSGILAIEANDGQTFTVDGTLTGNGGTVDMTNNNITSITRAVPNLAYEILNIDRLTGSGATFLVDTDLAGEIKGDKIVIAAAEAGKHYIQIKDYSLYGTEEVTGKHRQLIVTDDSGNLTFEGRALNMGGLFDIIPTIEEGVDSDIDNWYLTKIAKSVNEDTNVLLNAVDNGYALWRNTNDSLRSRLGELCRDKVHDDGIWARTKAGGFNGDKYGGRYSLYQIGYDKTIHNNSTYGFAIDHGDSTDSYNRGSGKSQLTSFSLYSVWQADDGGYTNVTARYGMFDTDLESYGQFPDKADYKAKAYSLSVEYGKYITISKQGWFIEPQAQFTFGRLNGMSYTTERGTHGEIDNMNSAIARLGFVLGQKHERGSIYIKGDILHEFAGKRNIRLSSNAAGSNDVISKHSDYSDTWVELGIGGNLKLGKNTLAYGEVERGFGGKINKKWQINMGVRVGF